MILYCLFSHLGYPKTKSSMKLYCFRMNKISITYGKVEYETLLSHYTGLQAACEVYSTVTDLAKLRGLSTSVPRAKAAW